jgi:hypothetical protein
MVLFLLMSKDPAKAVVAQVTSELIADTINPLAHNPGREKD